MSPGWPRADCANGIVSAIEELIPPLRGFGIETQVLAWSGETGADGDPVTIIGEQRPANRLLRLRHSLEWRVSPQWATRRRAVERILATLRQDPGPGPLDILEIEESFGRAGALQGELEAALVVALHGPWFIHGSLAGESPRDPTFRVRVRAERESLERADFVIAPSCDVLERSRRYYGLALRHAAIVPYAVTRKPREQTWRLDRCDPRRVLFVGRFDLHKGGDLVIDAFERVVRSRPDAQLVFVGPDRGLADSTGRTWHIDEYVESRLPGALARGSVEIAGQLAPDAIEELRLGALVTLSCSRWENLSLAVLEAMAAGCPLIASDRGGVPEHVKHGETGLLFRAQDPVDLAKNILRLLADPAEASRLGSGAIEHVERELDPRRIAQLRIDVYRRALSERTRRPGP